MDYTIHVNDIEIQVYERGQRESDHLLILLHGGPGSGAKPLMELSSFQTLELTNHCIYFDQRGSGKSYYDLQKGLDITQLCEDVHAIIEDSKKRWYFKKIVLWGGSFGGMLACAYMQKFKDVDGLILSSPAVTFDRSQALAFFQRTKESMKKRLPSFEVGGSDKQSNFEPEIILLDKQFQAFVFSEHNPSNSLKHVVAMAPWFYHYNASDAFEDLKIPVLIMLGKEDPICDSSIVLDKLASLQKDNITSSCFSPCGHAIFEDCKKDFIEHIQKYLFAL